MSLVICLHDEARGQDSDMVPAGQEVKRSELAKLIQEIDVKYKSGKEISKYHKYEKNIGKQF